MVLFLKWGRLLYIGFININLFGEKYLYILRRFRVIVLFAVLVTPLYNNMCVIIVLFTEFLILQSQNRNHTRGIFGIMNKKIMLL